MLYHIPQFLKPGVLELSKTKIEFDNGSSLLVGATSETGLSGATITGMLLMDECVFYDTEISLYQIVIYQ